MIDVNKFIISSLWNSPVKARMRNGPSRQSPNLFDLSAQCFNKLVDNCFELLQLCIDHRCLSSSSLVSYVAGRCILSSFSHIIYLLLTANVQFLVVTLH